MRGGRINSTNVKSQLLQQSFVLFVFMLSVTIYLFNESEIIHADVKIFANWRQVNSLYLKG